MNLNQIIEKKKEEFDVLLSTFETAAYWDGEGATDGEPKVAETKAEMKSFLEKAIRESVEEALREVSKDSLDFYVLDVAENKAVLENKLKKAVKEFMK